MSEPTATAAPMGRLARLALLRPLEHRDYRLVWSGESISLLGDQFHYVALSWLVLGMTGSGLALGTVLLASALPRGAFLLVGGVLSDRVSPRLLMLGSNVIRALLTTAIAVLVLGSQIQVWQLVLAGLIFGTVDAVFFPAISTIVAHLVPRERLMSANALLQGTQQLMNTVGPAVAGFAIAVIGLGLAFAIDAASFAVAALALWLVRSDGLAAAPDTAATAAGDGHRPGLMASLADGTRTVLGDPVLRILVILSTAFNLAFTGPIVVGLPWLVRVRFDGDASMLGLLLAAFGGGSVIGIALAGSVPKPRTLGWLVLGVATALGAGLCAIGVASAPVAGVVLLLVGSGVGFLNVSIISWTQARTEPHLLGRTMSFLMLGSVVAAPLSLALAGVLVDANATAMFVVAGALVVVVALAGLATGLHRRMAW